MNYLNELRIGNPWAFYTGVVMCFLGICAAIHSRKEWLVSSDPELNEQLARTDRELDFDAQMERIERKRDRLEQEARRIQIREMERMMTR